MRQANAGTPRSAKRSVKAARPAAPPRTLTSPDKILFPIPGFTKQQVADYYRAVAPLLLPELVRRPVTLVRCPDGVDSPCFFQKHHADSFGPNVRAVDIVEKDGGSEAYPYVEDIAGVLDLVQKGDGREFELYVRRPDGRWTRVAGRRRLPCRRPRRRRRRGDRRRPA